jgi:uncharacterized protein YutE (UPF0331/DUF86 family)
MVCNMDWKQFFAALIGHVAWPAVFIVLLIICRRHIASLADRLSELSYGGAKLTFERKLMEGASIIEKAPEQPPALPPPESKKTADSAWKTSNAVDQIISRYEQVNGILFSISDKAGFDVADARSAMYSMAHKGIVSKEIVDLYGTVKDARNIVVHAGVMPSEEQAREYARQAAYLLEVLHTVQEKFDRGEVQF